MQKQETNQLNKIEELIKDYPSLGEFLMSHQPAQTVQEATKFLTTDQILNLCNEIVEDETLSKKILYDFLKLNNYVIHNIGNDTLCWAIKSL
jgi:hypothetical protein